MPAKPCLQRCGGKSRSSAAGGGGATIQAHAGLVAHASAEQRTDMARVTHNICSMDKSSQQNAALMEDAANHAHLLRRRSAA